MCVIWDRSLFIECKSDVYDVGGVGQDSCDSGRDVGGFIDLGIGV